MILKKSLLFFIVLVLSQVLLLALPQDQEVFLDFEDAEGSGDFTLGVPPNQMRFIGFTVETLDDPALLHSGTKAITLGPGEEGKIVYERGIEEIEFYVAENTGAGKIEARGWQLILHENYISLLPQYVVTGLPTIINPDSNPSVQRFVAVRADFRDLGFIAYYDGIAEIKFFNVTGKLVIDDLGFTLSDEPRNNTVYTTFCEFNEAEQEITVGSSPFAATFTDGFVRVGELGNQRRTCNLWRVLNGETSTITFETPAARVQFYATATQNTATQGQSDGTIEVFDTEDNLLITLEDFPADIREESLPLNYKLIASELGAVGGIAKMTLSDKENVNPSFSLTGLADFGFTPIGTPGFEDTPTTPAVPAPEITTQPVSQSVTSGHTATLSVEATGDDLTYQWYGGSSPDVNWPVEGATESAMTTGALGAGANFWVQVTNEGGTADSDTAAITVTVPLVLSGSGSIAGEDIAHPNGNVFDQILLTGESIKLQAKPGQITRVSFMDEEEDIVQVEYSGAGAFTVTLDSSTFLAAKAPPRYNQSGVAYVTGKPSVVIEGADSTTYFSIFTVGKINAVNQALFPEGQEYDAQANVSLVQVINSTGMGGMQLSNAVFSGSTGNIGIDARGVPIAVRLTVGDIDASGDAVPHLLFGSGSFTVAAGNPGLRITGGDLVQTNAASVVVAESGSTTTGFETLISQNNFKSDNTPQPTLSVDATFANEDGDAISVTTEELTIE